MNGLQSMDVLQEWLVAMGLGPNKKTSSLIGVKGERKTSDVVDIDSEEAKKLAAAALSAVRETTFAASAAKGRIEVSAWCDLDLYLPFLYFSVTIPLFNLSLISIHLFIFFSDLFFYL